MKTDWYGMCKPIPTLTAIYGILPVFGYQAPLGRLWSGGQGNDVSNIGGMNVDTEEPLQSENTLKLHALVALTIWSWGLHYMI